ncbi:hypothetical protein MATL_G00022080 [Megalops atlanticus]|uniref:Ig-like domain-containing protein n=1 Tax=Megalops atlanticus TaxID=7932 RepID=A0A9D3TC77_MEGAT|nr:hypothetical protein MATL_G00022080 [Megalops atlanticus]
MAATPVPLWALVWIIAVVQCKIPDARVTCLFSEDCLLPCAFKPSGEELIRWSRQEVPVHGFQQGADLLDQQDPHFQGRTALFPEQVAHGNASLLLRLCNTQDRGRYRCHIHTAQGDQDAFVIVKVEAPVRSLTLEMSRLSGYKEVRCSSRDIYPAPHVWWSTDPPAPPDALKPTTRKMPEKNGLYSVESKLRRLGGLSDYTYFCTVNSSYDTQSWRASLREREMLSEEGRDLTIPCLAPTGLQNFTLTWTFARADEPTLILTFHSQTQHTSDRWAGRARVDPDRARAGDGSLRIQSPQSAEHTGTYICAFSGPRSRHAVHTRVNVTATAVGRSLMDGPSRLWIVAVVIAALVLLVAALALYSRVRGEHPAAGKPTEEATELEAVEAAKDKAENGTPSERSRFTREHNEERT